MAHRATVLMEKDAPKRAGRGSRASAPRAVPVDLRKVVAPYKHQGRLTVRAEQMPPLARFSAGRNNGDNSWSFAMDELEDLLYLPGTALDEPVTLTIRVIAQDSTIAVLDYDITPEISISVVEPGAPSAAALEQLRNLRDELADMALRLAAREADLDAARSETKTAQSELVRARAASETDEARAKAARLSGDLQALQKTLAERDGELAQLRATAAATPAKSERAIREAIAKAEKIWQAGEATRLSAAEARWREQSEQALAQLRGTAKKTDDEKRGEFVRLTGELATLRKQFAERDSELVQLRAAAAGMQAEIERAIREAVSRAEENWKAGEAAHLSAAEARLREQSDRALADARTAAGRSLGEQQSELGRLTGELATLRTQIAERDSELTRLRATVTGTPAEIERAIREAVSRAEENWKAGEAARLSAAEARLREQSEKALADARTAAGRSLGEKQSELGRLTGELATLRTQIAERDSELTRLRATVTGTPAEIERAIRDAISKAEESWKAGEAQRLAVAEARLREQSDRTLADTRLAAQKTLDDEKTEREKLNGELAGLRARLAEREADVAKLQSAVLQAGARQERNFQDALETWKAGEAVRLEAAHAHWKTQAAELRAEFETQQARVQSDAHAHADAQSAQHEAELRRLNNDLASFRQLLAARDGELVQSRAAAGQAQTRAEQEIDITRANAERDARERFAAKLAEAVARYETAEAALGEMRRRAGAQGSDETAVLRDEINTLRMVLANREAELAQSRLASVKADGQSEGDERPDNGGFIFAALALACAVMAAILFYPQIVPMLPYEWQVELANLTGGIQYDTNAVPAAKTPPPPAAPAQPKAIVAASVNLRAEASAKSEVRMTLQPGTEVAEIRQSGNWTFVEARAGQRAQTGWVYNSFLKPEDSSPKAGGH